MMENEAYVVELVCSNGRGKYHLKSYYEGGMTLLARERKAQLMGVPQIWIDYKYSQSAQIRGSNLSLKDLLFRAKRIDLESKFYTLKSKKYHKKLLTNRCEELKRVISDYCSVMKQFESKIVNHKVCTGNIYLVKNDNWRLGEWGFSSFRESHTIQGMEFENRVEPILKSQKEWFVPPEYMAPEILRAVAFGEESDLIALGAAPDIWYLFDYAGLWE